MKLFEYIDRINLLDKLIKEKRTGSLDELAVRMNLSKSRMCRVIEDLKLKGVPIEYSRQLYSYYYTSSYQMQVKLDFKPLDNEAISLINGSFFIYTSTSEKINPLIFLCNGHT